MTFEQLRRNRDDLALLRIGAMLPIYGTFLRQDGVVRECYSKPTRRQELAFKPLLMANSAGPAQTVLPGASILDTFLSIARPKHGTSAQSMSDIPPSSAIGVLIKMEFLKPRGWNAPRR